MLHGSAFIRGRSYFAPPPTDERHTTVLRNDLITLLAEKDNDTVTVDVNGLPVDIEAVTTADGTIVLRLDPEGSGLALDWAVSHAAKPDPS